jgi:hypothetical protein
MDECQQKFEELNKMINSDKFNENIDKLNSNTYNGNEDEYISIISYFRGISRKLEEYDKCVGGYSDDTMERHGENIDKYREYKRTINNIIDNQSKLVQYNSDLDNNRQAGTFSMYIFIAFAIIFLLILYFI